MAQSPRKGADAPKRIKKISFAYLKRLSAGVSLVAFFVVIAAGVRADNRALTIAWRAFLAILVIGIINWFVVKILASYEEMNSGKA